MKNALELDRYMSLAPVPEEGIVYHAPFEQPIRLSGLAFADRTVRAFRRLPDGPDGKVFLNDRVDTLANYTAGVQMAFRSDSRKVIVKAKLMMPSSMDHMPQTGSSAFDLYVGGPGAWRAVTAARYPLHDTEFRAALYEVELPGEREYLIDFPLYNGVESVWIGLEEGSSLLPPSPWSAEAPVVVYGTSITQGGCASRPGMAWTNILSRRRNREFLNFGFSGNGRGEPEMAECLGSIAAPAAYILDYEANSHYEGMRNTLETFLAILRKHHPEVPIAVISALPHRRSIAFGRPDAPDVHPDTVASREYQRALIAKLRAAGDRNVHFIAGNTLLGDDWDECMMDGCHLNDLGFYRMAENLNRQLPF